MAYDRVYIGRLPRDATEREIERLVEDFGRVTGISAHSGFAFVEFRDERCARDCVNTLDGERYAGVRLRVEPARSQGSGHWRDYNRLSPRYEGRYSRGDYRMIVNDLPARTSWQDLKDLMRKAGEVVYTDIAEDGSGIVEFSNSSDLERALHLFNGYEFQGRVLKVSESSHHKSRSSHRRRGSSESRSLSNSRSRSRSPYRRSRRYHKDSPRNYSKSTSRSRSRSPAGVSPESMKSPPKSSEIPEAALEKVESAPSNEAETE